MLYLKLYKGIYTKLYYKQVQCDFRNKELNENGLKMEIRETRLEWTRSSDLSELGYQKETRVKGK